MKKYWDNLFGLHAERTLWVEPEELGKEKPLWHHNQQYFVKIPAEIHKEVTLRLKGLGRTRQNQTGDLLLHVRLNQGEDLSKNLWLSESAAKYGGDKLLAWGDGQIRVMIPRQSYPGLAIRLKGLGAQSEFQWRAPFLRRRNGNLLVKLMVYPDVITPAYGSFETLPTEDMVLEGWVYRKIDELLAKIGQATFNLQPVQAEVIADTYNLHGWRGIFRVLVEHLGLTWLNIVLLESDTLTAPGYCQKTVTYQEHQPPSSQYSISIHTRFLDNPFTVAAILAHELCHVVYGENAAIQTIKGLHGSNAEQETLQEERTVDLLVFMFKIGEFQLRVSRDTRLTFGYFNQEIFERMYVIVSKKLKSS
jgi:hypothetical protein